MKVVDGQDLDVRQRLRIRLLAVGGKNMVTKRDPDKACDHTGRQSLFWCTENLTVADPHEGSHATEVNHNFTTVVKAALIYGLRRTVV
jgi:hypothetical protein